MIEVIIVPIPTRALEYLSIKFIQRVMKSISKSIQFIISEFGLFAKVNKMFYMKN